MGLGNFLTSKKDSIEQISMVAEKIKKISEILGIDYSVQNNLSSKQFDDILISYNDTVSSEKLIINLQDPNLSLIKDLRITNTHVPFIVEYIVERLGFQDPEINGYTVHDIKKGISKIFPDYE